MKFLNFVSIAVGMIFSMEAWANPTFSNELLTKAEMVIHQRN